MADTQDTSPVRNALTELARIEAEEGTGTPEYNEILELAGFEPDDGLGVWVGPPGTSITDQDYPGQRLLTAFTAWDEQGQVPGDDEGECISALAASLGIDSFQLNA